MFKVGDRVKLNDLGYLNRVSTHDYSNAYKGIITNNASYPNYMIAWVCNYDDEEYQFHEAYFHKYLELDEIITSSLSTTISRFDNYLKKLEKNIYIDRDYRIRRASKVIVRNFNKKKK